MRKKLELSKYIACICEGGAEKVHLEVLQRGCIDPHGTGGSGDPSVKYEIGGAGCQDKPEQRLLEGKCGNEPYQSDGEDAQNDIPESVQMIPESHWLVIIGSHDGPGRLLGF